MRNKDAGVGINMVWSACLKGKTLVPSPQLWSVGQIKKENRMHNFCWTGVETKTIPEKCLFLEIDCIVDVDVDYLSVYKKRDKPAPPSNSLTSSAEHFKSFMVLTVHLSLLISNVIVSISIVAR